LAARANPGGALSEHYKSGYTFWSYLGTLFTLDYLPVASSATAIVLLPGITSAPREQQQSGEHSPGHRQSAPAAASGSQPES